MLGEDIFDFVQHKISYKHLLQEEQFPFPRGRKSQRDAAPNYTFMYHHTALEMIEKCCGSYVMELDLSILCRTEKTFYSHNYRVEALRQQRFNVLFGQYPVFIV